MSRIPITSLPPEVRAALGATAKKRIGRGVRRAAGEMNRVERAYAEHLALRQAAGEVVQWGFERIKLQLADRTFYTPDFFVMLACGEIEMHDTKGSKKKPDGTAGYWCEEKGRIKIKLAAELFPFRFKIVFRAGGVWKEEEV